MKSIIVFGRQWMIVTVRWIASALWRPRPLSQAQLLQKIDPSRVASSLAAGGVVCRKLEPLARNFRRPRRLRLLRLDQPGTCRPN
jgi:hypothetical protein